MLPVESIIKDTIIKGEAGSVKSVESHNGGKDTIVEFTKPYDLMLNGMVITFANAAVVKMCIRDRLYVGHLSITIKPFAVQLPYWHRSLGLFLLILSFIVYNAGERAKGYIDGMKEGERIVLELLKKKTE